MLATIFLPIFGGIFFAATAALLSWILGVPLSLDQTITAGAVFAALIFPVVLGWLTGKIRLGS